MQNGHKMTVDAKRLRAEWIARGYTNEAFAAKIGVSNSTISRWLKGGADSITIAMANKIVQTLGLSGPEASTIFFAPKIA